MSWGFSFTFKLHCMNKEKLIKEIKRMVADFGDFSSFPYQVTSEGVSAISVEQEGVVTVFHPFAFITVESLKHFLEEMYIVHFQTTVDETQFA